MAANFICDHLGAMRKYPIRTLEVIADHTPLYLVIYKVAHKPIFRILEEGAGVRESGSLKTTISRL